jgi:hypothetical protein
VLKIGRLRVETIEAAVQNEKIFIGIEQFDHEQLEELALDRAFVDARLVLERDHQWLLQL